jgi:hypothetical protein
LFLYPAQAQNPIRTAPEFNLLLTLQSIKNTVFSNSVVVRKS